MALIFLREIDLMTLEAHLGPSFENLEQDQIQFTVS